jgi:hypothetical protein
VNKTLSGLALVGTALSMCLLIPHSISKDLSSFRVHSLTSQNPGQKFVIAHYFPLFEVSIAPQTEHGDYYEQNFLSPHGENDKFLTGRGFVRERPLLPRGGIQSRQQAFDLDIARAAEIGIDAFGIDLFEPGSRSWEVAEELLSAAARSRKKIRIVPEPDMTVLKATSPQKLAKAIEVLISDNATFMLSDGRKLVMPFASEHVSPGYWKEFTKVLAQDGYDIALAHDFIDPNNMASYARESWAATRWGTRDLSSGDVQNDFHARAQRAGYERWIATVAPQDMRPKDLIMAESEGTGSLRSAFDAAQQGNAIGVHIATWNDYSEGTEIAPSSAALHSWYDLVQWYIAKFKKGKNPTIRKDSVIAHYRRQIFVATETKYGSSWQNKGTTPVQNIVDVAAFLTRKATIRIRVGNVEMSRVLTAGASRIVVPARPGKVAVSVVRSGRVILRCTGAEEIVPKPARHDPLYIGFSSSRDCS